MPFAVNLIGPDIAAAANDIRTAAQGPKYRVGTKVCGSEGREYIYFSTAAGHADSVRISVAHATGASTAAAGGRWDTIGVTAAGGFGWAASVENYTAAAGTETVVP